MSFPQLLFFPLGRYYGNVTSGIFNGNRIDLHFNRNGSVQGSIIQIIPRPEPESFPIERTIATLSGQYTRIGTGRVSLTLRTSSRLLIRGQVFHQGGGLYIVGREESTYWIMPGGSSSREFRANLIYLPPLPPQNPPN